MDLKRHLITEYHQSFANKSKNFSALDDLIKQLPLSDLTKQPLLVKHLSDDPVADQVYRITVQRESDHHARQPMHESVIAMKHQSDVADQVSRIPVQLESDHQASQPMHESFIAMKHQSDVADQVSRISVQLESDHQASESMCKLNLACQPSSCVMKYQLYVKDQLLGISEQHESDSFASQLLSDGSFAINHQSVVIDEVSIIPEPHESETVLLVFNDQQMSKGIDQNDVDSIASEETDLEADCDKDPDFDIAKCSSSSNLSDDGDSSDDEKFVIQRSRKISEESIVANSAEEDSLIFPPTQNLTMLQAVISIDEPGTLRHFEVPNSNRKYFSISLPTLEPEIDHPDCIDDSLLKADKKNCEYLYNLYIFILTFYQIQVLFESLLSTLKGIVRDSNQYLKVSSSLFVVCSTKVRRQNKPLKRSSRFQRLFPNPSWLVWKGIPPLKTRSNFPWDRQQLLPYGY